MCRVQTTTNLELITRLRGKQDSIKRGGSGKRKFKLHVDVQQAVDFHSGSAFLPQIDKREVRGDVK